MAVRVTGARRNVRGSCDLFVEPQFLFYLFIYRYLQSILALRIFVNLFWRGAVTWLDIYNKSILVTDEYNL